MATYTKHILSGSTDGLPVAIAATSTPGTLIHAAHATAQDEVWLYVNNIDATAVNLTLEWGGTAVSEQIIASVPACSGLFLLVPGSILTNSKTVRAFANIANKVNVIGWVNRISA